MFCKTNAARQHTDCLGAIGCFLLILYAALAIAWCRRYNAGFLLWFCDVALLLTALGLLFRSAALVTAELTAVLVFHLAWNIDFWLYLLFGYSLTGATDYMFYPELNIAEKSLSFFNHAFVVPAAVYGVCVLGISRKAWLLQWLQTSLLFVLTYLLTRPEENINWMFGTVLSGLSPGVIRPIFYYTLMILVPPLLIYFPINRLLALTDQYIRKRQRDQGTTLGPLLDLSPTGAVIAMTLAVGLSFVAAHAANRKCLLDAALFEIGPDGNSALERMPQSSEIAQVDQIVFGGKGAMREASLVTWRRLELPKMWSGVDRKLHVHSKGLLLDLDQQQIPPVPQEVILRGRRVAPGSVVWAYVASDDFYLQGFPDLRGNNKAYEVRCEIGGHGISEYVNSLDGKVYPSTDHNELLGNGVGAVYVLGIVEVIGGRVIARSPFYVVKRKGIRFPDDVWYEIKDEVVIPLLSDSAKPFEARVAFQSSPDPVHIPTHVFTASFFGYEVRDLTLNPDRFEGFLAPDGAFCDSSGWISTNSLRYCTQVGKDLVLNSVSDRLVHQGRFR